MTLLFDYGGTLDTSARHWYYIIREAYAHAGLGPDRITDEQLRAAYVYGERALAKHPIIREGDDFKTLLLKKMDCELEKLEADDIVFFTSETERQAVQECLAAYCDNYARCHTECSARVLEKLASKHRLIAVSNFYGNLHEVLRTYGLLAYFDTIIESAVVGVRKPDPAIWQLGIAAAKDTNPVFAIGDSYTKDILPARAAGCLTVWFKGEEWEEKAYDETVPDHIITHIDDLLKLF